MPFLKAFPLAIVAAHTVSVGRFEFRGLIGFEPGSNLGAICFLFGAYIENPSVRDAPLICVSLRL